ncbi:M55 family metallopeptidase [Paracoccus sp. (in: a-proteobacteria)]|uniref:M55 family metallopeptidase n=1 Tax=Paracoccus sp. TaxID=267 RepID=UPI003A878A5D
MKIFISVDIEGVAGVCEPVQGQRGNPEYETARRLMTEEANAAIVGAFDGGATEVTVADSHGAMRNIIAGQLDPRASLISGKPRPLSMIEGLRQDHDGVVLIGYHAAAGERGVLAHTISGLAFSRIRMNGQIVGEPTLFAGHAAEIGVPLLAASGDDRLCDEIARQFPSAVAICTKSAIGAHASKSLSPQSARDLIGLQVRSAVAQASGRKPEAPCHPPLEVEVGLTRQVFADAASLLPFVTRLDGNSVSFQAQNHAEVIGTLSVLALASLALA